LGKGVDMKKNDNRKADKKAIASNSIEVREVEAKRAVEPLPHIFFSISDLTKMFKVSRSFIVNAMSNKKLSYYSMGRRKLFDQGQVQAFAEKIKRGELAAGIER
jgi:hypothetical protein